MYKIIPFSFRLASLALLFAFSGMSAQQLIQAEDILRMKNCTSARLHPDGHEILYGVYTPRGANEKAGPARLEWYRMSLDDQIAKPLFPDNMKGSSPEYSPDGKHIAFLYAKKGKQRQVWLMPAEENPPLNAASEIAIRLTDAPAGVGGYLFQPGSNGIAYLARPAVGPREKELKERGYGFIFYEENLKNSQLFLASFNSEWQALETRKLTTEGHAWDFIFNPAGTQIAVSISPKNLIDHRYMFRRIHLVDLASGEIRQVSENEGKLGNYAFSPDGRHLAYAAALNINDHQVSQAYVADLDQGAVRNLTPGDFPGHISWVGWKNAGHLLYLSAEGVYNRLSTCPVEGGPREVMLDARKEGIIFRSPVFTPDRQRFVFTGSTPSDPVNLYSWDSQGPLQKLTDLNPGIATRRLGKQEVIRFAARDGQQIEGLMIYPVDYQKGRQYPLIVYVHGGPESHHSHSWLSRYSTPGQLMAGKGYLVMYLNYRASTGYGVDFAMEGFEDPAGKEFDDLADGIEWAVRTQGADPGRVGMAGGSYGGYASAWFATYYTKYVKAVCMFVGISNNISKRNTTDIAYEELYVHSGKLLEEMWQFDLERSPVYWAHQSKTATLIYGGAADTRVHPSQSIELYRRMKMNEHPAVRLVQYPGEGHGNRRQVGQIDVLHRQVAWLDWYVRDAKPLEGPMPPLDISDAYGLDWKYTKQ